MRRALPYTVMLLVPMALWACASAGGSSDGTSDSASVDADAAASTSSTVSLTRVGEAVQLTEDAEETHECEFVVHLPLSGSLSGARVSDVNAMRALRNEAGRQGANLVLLVMETRTRIARAEGYLCAD